MKVGNKGEIYTTKEIRERIGIKTGGRVRAIIKNNELIIKPLPSIEELIKKPRPIKLTPEEAEKISEEVQKEAGIWPDSS